MFAIRHETLADVPAREALLDTCFGSNRRTKTSERLREGRLPAEDLALVVERDGALAATIRFWNVAAGPGRPALLLGPVAVEPALQGVGIGGRLIREGLARAAALGHGAVILVGDEPYYRRFGFSADPVASLWMPGPCERERFLGLELRAGALAGARGMISGTGRAQPLPDLQVLVRAAVSERVKGLRAAA